MNVTPPPDGTALGLATLVLALLMALSTDLRLLAGQSLSSKHPFRLPAYMRTPTPKAYERFSHTLETFPSDTSLSGMRHLGLRYLILQDAYYDGQGHLALAAFPRLELVTEVDQFIIYEFQQ